MKKFDRAVRRCNKERMKEKAMRIKPHYPEAYKLADHLAHCSCCSCCNARRNGYSKVKETIPEYMNKIGFYEQVSELENTYFKIKNRKKNKKHLY